MRATLASVCIRVINYLLYVALAAPAHLVPTALKHCNGSVYVSLTTNRHITAEADSAAESPSGSTADADAPSSATEGVESVTSAPAAAQMADTGIRRGLLLRMNSSSMLSDWLTAITSNDSTAGASATGLEVEPDCQQVCTCDTDSAKCAGVLDL